MYKAVFRIEPISTSKLNGAAGHITREQQHDIHIDIDRLEQNITLIGSNTVSGVRTDITDEMSRHKALDKRTNDIIASGILTANKDYFDTEFAGWREDSSVLQPWIDANMRFLTSGDVGIVKSAVLHLDEEAPHIHFLSVPVATVTRGNRYGIKEVERMSYSALFSDSAQHIAECRENGTTSTDTKLGKLQTVYADAVKCVSLARGITSEVRHVRPKDFRDMINGTTQKIGFKFNIEKPTLWNYKQTHVHNINNATVVSNKLADRANAYSEASSALRVKNDLLKKKAEAQERTIVKMNKTINEQAAVIRENKDYIDAMRHLNSDAVIKAFGYKKEAYSDYNFNRKFNAVDFVKTVEKCDFNTALLLIAEHFSEDDIKPVVMESQQIKTKIDETIVKAVSNDNAELETFKRDISLIDFAISHGFNTKNKSTSSATLQDGGYKIIVSRQQDKDVFFDVHDEEKAGTIIDFCKHYLGIASLGEIRKTLRMWMGSGTVEVNRAKRMRQKEPTRLQEITHNTVDKTPDFYRLKPCSDNGFLKKRGITIHNDDIREDSRGNVCFPHYIDGVISGWEVKNSSFKGFSAGGKKGYGQVSIGDGEGVAIAESMLDALSYAQLHPGTIGICISTGGAASDEQLASLAEHIQPEPGLPVYIATDNDNAGKSLAERIAAVMPGAERALPDLKDWNDVLLRQCSPRIRCR